MMFMSAAKLGLTVLASMPLVPGHGNGMRHPQCHVAITQNVTDDLGNIWKAGQILPVDIARASPSGMSFCAHGGSRIPRRRGDTQAVRLLNCRVGVLIDGPDHELVPIARSHGKRSMAVQ